jgi:hypothetical protein
MKHYFLVLFLVTVGTCFSQNKSIFHNENGKIRALDVENYFNSLSAEVIEEIQKVKPSTGEFMHLVTDKNQNYFLSDVAQLSAPQKNNFYQKLFDNGFSFQVDHGLPNGYVWIIFPKDKFSLQDGLQRITNLYQQSIN